MNEVTSVNDPIVVWHIGFQKTGTTTFQRAMWRTMAPIGEHTQLFPKSGSTDKLRRACVNYLRTGKSEDRRAVSSEVAEIVATTVKSGKPSAVVSDENLFGYFFYNEKTDIFRAAREMLPLLSESAKPARSVFVIYTRDFEKWLKSAHNQIVKQLRCTEAFDDWYAQVPFEKEWNVHRDRIQASVRDPVHFVSLEEEISAGRQPGEKVLELAGVPRDVIDNISWPPRSNESLSSGALEFMLKINQSDLKQRGVKIVRDIVVRSSSSFR